MLLLDNTTTDMKILLGGSSKVALILSDVELAKFIINSDNVYRSASRAAFAIAAFYTHKASMSIDVLSFQYTSRANAFRELAIELGKQADNYVGATSFDFGYIEPITENQTDNSESIFHKKMFTLEE